MTIIQGVQELNQSLIHNVRYQCFDCGASCSILHNLSPSIAERSADLSIREAITCGDCTIPHQANKQLSES